MFDVIPITSPKINDCGATCLQMLLAYYGIDVDLDTLIRDCNTGISGCTMKDIAVAARKHGMPDAKCYMADVAGAVDVDRPGVVWWKYRHFCVSCGRADDGQIVICNPDRGRYRMSEGVFKSFYSGYVLFNGIPEDVIPEDRE